MEVLLWFWIMGVKELFAMLMVRWVPPPTKTLVVCFDKVHESSNLIRVAAQFGVKWLKAFNKSLF